MNASQVRQRGMTWSRLHTNSSFLIQSITAPILSNLEIIFRSNQPSISAKITCYLVSVAVLTNSSLYNTKFSCLLTSTSISSLPFTRIVYCLFQLMVILVYSRWPIPQMLNIMHVPWTSHKWQFGRPDTSEALDQVNVNIIT